MDEDEEEDEDEDDVTYLGSRPGTMPEDPMPAKRFRFIRRKQLQAKGRGFWTGRGLSSPSVRSLLCCQHPAGGPHCAPLPLVPVRPCIYVYGLCPLSI